MLSGSRRCCLRFKSYAQCRAPSEQPLHEPLLFLYPRWFSAIALSHLQSDSSLSASAQHTWKDLSKQTVDLGTGRKKSGRRSANSFSDAEPVIPQTSPAERSPKISGQGSAETKSLYGAHVAISDQVVGSGSAPSLFKSPSNESDATTEPTGQRKLHQQSSEAQKRRNLLPSQTPPKLDIRRYEPNLTIRRTRQSPFRRVLSEHLGPASNTQSVKKEGIERLHNPKHMDWSEPVKLLAQFTSRPKDTIGEEIELLKDTIYYLTGSVDANAWFHQVRWGCEVRVTERRASKREKRVIILHGSPRARELTLRYLLGVEQNLSQLVRQYQAAEDQQAPFRYVLSALKSHFPAQNNRRADAVERPHNWTVRSFADYVETLVTMEIPRLLRRELYGDNDSHNIVVAKVLETLFSDPLAEPFISIRALNHALRFTCKHTDVAKTSEVLLQKARHMGLSLQTDTFNIVVEESLRQNNIDQFRSMLAGMQHLGLVPNGMTWLALFRVVRSPGARRSVLQHMRRRWLVTQAVERHLVNQFVDTELARYAQERSGFSTFVEFMDGAFRLDWLSDWSINHMLNVCAEKKLWGLIPKILELATDRSVVYNSTNLTHLLKLFRERGSIHDSINLLDSHFAKTVGRDNTFAIPIVFMTAWNSRFYNVCRVLWRYAASHGVITYTMQNVVTSSLIKNNDESEDSQSHAWRTTAGKVIVGTNTDIAGLGSQYRRLMEESFTMNAMEWLAKWTPNNGARKEQLSLAYVIMQRDLTAWKRYRPMRSQQLFELLRSAYEKDHDWKRRKLHNYSSLPLMLKDAVDVPLIPADGGRDTDRDESWEMLPRISNLDTTADALLLSDPSARLSSKPTSTGPPSLVPRSSQVSKMAENKALKPQPPAVQDPTENSARDLATTHSGPGHTEHSWRTRCRWCNTKFESSNTLHQHLRSGSCPGGLRSIRHPESVAVRRLVYG